MQNFRVAHLRLKNGRPLTRLNGDDLSDYDKIVTVCWDLDRCEDGEDDSILRYGATVYRRNSANNEKTVDWVKKLHYKRAVERFESEPVIIAISDPMKFPNPLIDWFIAKNLIYKFGCKLSEKNAADVTISLPHRSIFKILYDPKNFSNEDSSSLSSSTDNNEQENQRENQVVREHFDMADELLALEGQTYYASPCLGFKFWAVYGLLVTLGLTYYLTI